LFIPEATERAYHNVPGFNPSVGILFVHTERGLPTAFRATRFQSLGRDSVCSYLDIIDRVGEMPLVSIPRSGFCLFILVQGAEVERNVVVSIPRSGFCLFILERSSPVGVGGQVSIPRSGFCLFIPHSHVSLRIGRTVSIPRSGFCLFIRHCAARSPVISVLFQSLGRDSVCSYQQAKLRARWLLKSFNPSVGILFVHTWMRILSMSVLACFNPSVGILFVHTAIPHRVGRIQILGEC